MATKHVLVSESSRYVQYEGHAPTRLFPEQNSSKHDLHHIATWLYRTAQASCHTFFLKNSGSMIDFPYLLLDEYRWASPLDPPQVSIRRSP